MTIKEITDFLETTAPLSLQESYDNCGLLVGDPAEECRAALICLDVTEETLREAVERNCNLIISHHPVIFRGLKKLNGSNATERIVLFAVRHNIALYAIHTNLDNIQSGVNGKIAEKLGLQKLQILQQKESQLKKLITFAPPEMAEKVREAIFAAGAGNIGKYSECSFTTTGQTTFTPGEGADPAIGEIGKRESLEEIKMEFIFQSHRERAIIRAMKDAHEYEEVAYDIIPLGNFLSDTGSGVIGELPSPVSEEELLGRLRTVFSTGAIRHSAFTDKPISKIALCGGAGSFLIHAAISSGADAYITSDLKYHEFFEPEGRLLLADIGHYESEQFTTELLHEILSRKFPNFALLKTGLNSNPVRYFGPEKN